MRPPQRPLEIRDHSIERKIERRPSADHYIVMADPHCTRRRFPHHLSQPPPDAIALDRGTDFARHGESDPHRPVVRSSPNLQHKGRRRRLGAARGGQEIPTMPQFLHGMTRLLRAVFRR